MAKHTCAICGAEIGLVSEQKLADGNYICRKVCSKKTFKIFNKVEATLGDVQAHIAQIEKGTKIWNELLLPLKKSGDREDKMKRFGTGGPTMYVSPSTGLIAVVEARYKFFIFGKTELACVYRIADLIQYDLEEETVTDSEGKEKTNHYCALLFQNTAGMYDFRIEVSGQKDYESMAKYFDKLFGIQKTLGNAYKNAKRQLDAFKAMAGAIKDANAGKLDGDTAVNAVHALDQAIYGDRTELIAKADAALANYQ